MKIKYVVVLTVELSERVTKKALREWMLEEIPFAAKVGLPQLTKVRVRSVDED